MAFNAYLVFGTKQGATTIKGESMSLPETAAQGVGALELTDYGFGTSMPVTSSRSDGGGATVGRANFDVFTCSKNIDTATASLFQYCCLGTAIPSIVLHLYRAGDESGSGAIKYAMYTFQWCVVTKVGISGGGEDLPKESLEFNYGKCEYVYHVTDKATGKDAGKPECRFGWSTISNKQDFPLQQWGHFAPDIPQAPS
jgi:type VI protein secretion system component Hcp